MLSLTAFASGMCADADGAPDALNESDPRSCIWKSAGLEAGLTLHDAALPFSKGELSFGGGMSVKMTVSRMQQWATSEGRKQYQCTNRQDMKWAVHSMSEAGERLGRAAASNMACITQLCIFVHQHMHTLSE